MLVPSVGAETVRVSSSSEEKSGREIIDKKNGSARAAHMHIDHTAAAARQERTSLPSFRFFFAWSRLFSALTLLL